jgi:hypothetical protein
MHTVAYIHTHIPEDRRICICIRDSCIPCHTYIKTYMKQTLIYRRILTSESESEIRMHHFDKLEGTWRVICNAQFPVVFATNATDTLPVVCMYVCMYNEYEVQLNIMHDVHTKRISVCIPILCKMLGMPRTPKRVCIYVFRLHTHYACKCMRTLNARTERIHCIFK